MFFHKSREKHGIRAWWHFGEDHACIKAEFYWWSPRFGVSVGTDDDGWNATVRVPPLALYLSFERLGLWQPMKTCVATWDNNRLFTIPDRRECEFTIHDWTVRLTPWGRWGEWAARDPWWIRGVSVNLVDLVLGRQRCHTERGDSLPVLIPMPEGTYHGIATPERRTWTRPRWFPHSRESVSLDIPKGIPHAGKGENSWDCGDDGLFGISGATVEDVIRRAQESVMESRRRHGHASDEAVKQALA